SGGQVQPLGVRKTIIGQAGRLTVAPLARASAQICLISGTTVSSTAANCWWTAAGSWPSTKYGFEPLPPQELCRTARGVRAREAGVGDLVAVEVEDRQDAAVAGRVDELVAVPAGRQRPRLGLAVANHAGDDQVGVVERRPERVAEGVAQLAALVEAAGRLRRDV